MTPQFQAVSSQSHLRGGRAAGLVMLFVGAALLVYVFMQSYGMLTHPIPGMTLPANGHPAGSAASTAPSVDFVRLGSSAVEFLLKLAVLLVMTIIGSVIAARGVHLYYVASGTVERVSSGSSSGGGGSAPALSISDAPIDPAAARLAGGQRQ